jgi:hypothetical protein
VGIRICDAILVFNVPWLEGHLEPDYHFAFLMFLDLRNNLKSNGSSLYKCSISYSTLKRSFAPRILTATSEGNITLCFIPSIPLTCSKKFHTLFFPVFRLHRGGSTCRLRSNTLLGPSKATSSGNGIGEVRYRNKFKITLVARLRNSSNASKRCQRGCLSSRENCDIPFPRTIPNPRGQSRRVLAKPGEKQKWPASILRTLREADLFTD